MTIHERLTAKIEKTDTCWLWQAGRNADGYGTIYADGRTRAAHRVSYEIHVGPIPEGMTLDHLCRVRHCVNPAHLEPVTNRENILRGTAPTATNARRTHCANGHLLAGRNLILKDGGRRCRTCINAMKRASRARLSLTSSD